MAQSNRSARKIILPGGAGLVGLNLIPRLKARNFSNIVVLDKHHNNLGIVQQMHPDVTIEWADLACSGPWERFFEDADTVVMLQAQIGAKERESYVRNTVTSTTHVLDAIDRYHVPYLIHISSSVLESKADDYYIQTKREQEELVLARGGDCVILRPTLMFGWFDRKHLGWLSRFMCHVPVFPIPGSGKYPRQPLYVGDFCGIIISSIEQRQTGGIYNITGMEMIDYIDIIRTIKETVGARAAIVKIPYALFAALLYVWAVFDDNPPFTISQLKALTTPDVFEVIDWPKIFGVRSTLFAEAIRTTLLDPVYSKIKLEF